jgi:hypothetical protein
MGPNPNRPGEDNLENEDRSDGNDMMEDGTDESTRGAGRRGRKDKGREMERREEGAGV